MAAIDESSGIAAPCSRSASRRKIFPSIRLPVTTGRNSNYGGPPVTARRGPADRNADDGRTPVTGMIKRGEVLSSCGGNGSDIGGAAAEAGWSAAVLPEFPGTGPRVAQPVAARTERTKSVRLSSSISSAFAPAFDLRKFPSRTFNATLRLGLLNARKDESRTGKAGRKSVLQCRDDTRQMPP